MPKNHSTTGIPRGRPRNQFGVSTRTDDAMLEQVHAEIESFMKEKFALLGEGSERYS
jgi:hypothetical protein